LNRLTEINILDFSNEGSSSQRPTTNNWEELKADNSIEYEQPKLHEKTVTAIKEIMKPVSKIASNVDKTDN
jgi:hypothetical protein